MVKQTLSAFELGVFESLLLQVAQDLADVVMDLLKPFAGADRFEDHQAALLQAVQIHIDGFHQLLFLA